MNQMVPTGASGWKREDTPGGGYSKDQGWWMGKCWAETGFHCDNKRGQPKCPEGALMATERQREEAQTEGFRKVSRKFLKQGGYRESEGDWEATLRA